MSTIVIDHDRAVIGNVAILEIGLRLGEYSDDPPTADVAERFLEAANFTASARHAAAAAASTQALTKLARTDPDRTDACLGQFFGGGSRDHIEGKHAPFVRLGHPPTPQRFRLDLANTSGVVVGVIRNAWLDGPQLQLRGDIVFLENPPIPDWTDVLTSILAMAADRPEDLGVSCAWLGREGSCALAVACDLVAHPASSRNGLLNLPSNGTAARHQSPVREIGRRRRYRADLGEQVGHLVYEALLEAWLDGREPV